MMLTLIDTRTGEAVRVTLKPEFFEKALNSLFVQKEERVYYLRMSPLK